MKLNSNLSRFTLASAFVLLTVGSALAQSAFRSQVAALKKNTDYYWVTCPESAPYGCTLYLTTVLNNGTLYTHVDPAVMPGQEVNINRVHVVESMTSLVQN